MSAGKKIINSSSTSPSVARRQLLFSEARFTPYIARTTLTWQINYTNNHKRNVIAFICELPVKHRLTARRSHIKYMTTPTIYIRCFKNRVVGRSRRLTLPGIPLTPCMRPRVCVGADTYFFCFYLNKKVL